ncbi:lipopolysaccharide transport system ATP-binding protein [Butyrivibrio sp. INlla18]|uniref:ABC transporter ATP-binding protein n=1 Tax=Butyrivibrio sp. INlla18 TaxID=1520806 RepID=UPI00087ECA95|nr:ABC transporter ATP-binding protein [Butyrivibrio sp. INlla18]SDA79169.1 lipopolysaccharide transport system ATP-binding protein [Butyrivibrio sp. INlla18]
MSSIVLNKADLIFNTKKDKSIKDILMQNKSDFSNLTQSGEVHAIDHMSLKINDGERVSVIGHNGAGKSTFLRLISGIYSPTSGEVNVEGEISGMYEFATGFEMEQNGWDNIYIRGLMLGLTPDRIIPMMPEIAEFSELGNYLNIPVKYYSSGMLIRLAFSVSTAIRPDILLLDEALSAGDASFIQKANERMKKMVDSSKILVLVTHSMQAAAEICNRCIWLDKGKIIMDDKPEIVTKEYIAFVENGRNKK